MSTSSADPAVPRGAAVSRTDERRVLDSGPPSNQSWVSLGSFVAGMVALAILLPLLVRLLGPTAYGAWVLTGGLVNYESVFDFGFSLTVTRFVASSRGSDEAATREAITTGLLAVGLVGALVAIACEVAAGELHGRLSVPGAATSLRLAGVSVLLVLASKVLQSAAEGAGRVAHSRIIQVVSSVGFAALAVVVASRASHSDQLVALGLLLVGQSAVTLCASLILVLHEWHWQLPVKRPSRHALRSVCGYALGLQTSSILAALVDPVGRYVVGAVAGPAAAGYVDIAARTRSQFFGAALAFTRPLLPRLGRAGRREGTTLTIVATRMFAVVAAAASVLTAAAVYVTFPRLFGAAVGSHVAVLSAVAVLLWTPSLLALVPYSYLLIFGRASDIVRVQVVTSAVAIAVAGALVVKTGAWAPVLGSGVGAVAGAAVTVRLVHRYSDDAAHVGSALLSSRLLRALVGSLGLAGFLFVPAPLVIRLAIAPGAWLLWVGADLRRLGRVL